MHELDHAASSAIDRKGFEAVLQLYTKTSSWGGATNNVSHFHKRMFSRHHLDPDPEGRPQRFLQLPRVPDLTALLNIELKAAADMARDRLEMASDRRRMFTWLQEAMRSPPSGSACIHPNSDVPCNATQRSALYDPSAERPYSVCSRRSQDSAQIRTFSSHYTEKKDPANFDRFSISGISMLYRSSTPSLSVPRGGPKYA